MSNKLLHTPLMVKTFIRLCEEHNIEFHIEPEYRYAGYFVSLSGKRHFFKNTRIDINGNGSSYITTDKDFCSYFLRREGFKVPNSLIFFSTSYYHEMCRKNPELAHKLMQIEDALQFAKNHGFPVFVKPNTGSQGLGVYKATTCDQIREAYDAIINNHRYQQILIQSEVEGKDYRVVVLKDEVICAYKRMPFCVIGNGIDSLKDIFYASPIKCNKYEVENDTRLNTHLKNQHVDWHDIIEKGRSIELFANANLSTFGQMEDVTDRVAKNIQSLCIDATHCLGLTLAGVDIITDDIANPDCEATILEVNSSPSTSFYQRFEETSFQRTTILYEKIFNILLHR